ncbi:MAG: uroporphyrinogen-III synthase [Rhodoferax sp.]
MRVIVTRPAREALRWAADLSAGGLEALAIPLITIGPVDNPSELLRVGRQVGIYAGVMFVSANAADYFFASSALLAPLFASDGAITTRAWATGPGTGRALARAGVAPERIDLPAADSAQFDSEALWQMVRSQLQPGDRVLIVRGADDADGADSRSGSGRDWFAGQVAAAGAQVEFVAAYRRRAPEFDPAERELARQAAHDGSVWLFSSAQALRNLMLSLPGQSWSQARALATHPRIADAARSAGFAVVRQARPALPDLLAALKSYDVP